MIPLVTVHAYVDESSGAPTANAVSPTFSASLLPSSAIVIILFLSIPSTATSEYLSEPSISTVSFVLFVKPMNM
jgi:hypothetical protein